MHIILSAKAAWAAVKDVEVKEKVRTASMMARKSRVDIEYVVVAVLWCSVQQHL